MNAIAECVRVARTADRGEIESATTQITEVEAVIKRAEERRISLLGIERNAIGPLEKRIRELRQAKSRLLHLSQFGHLPCMSLEPLTWRDDKGWPRIALIGLDSPKVQFGVVGKRDDYGYRRWRRTFEPGLPFALQECYKDVMGALGKLAKANRQSAYLAAEYVGIIPDETREKIAEAKKQFPHVFIAAEVKNWQVLMKTIPKPRPRSVDPLVVGFDGANLWIVDHFYLTSVEKYIKDEFCV